MTAQTPDLTIAPLQVVYPDFLQHLLEHPDTDV